LNAVLESFVPAIIPVLEVGASTFAFSIPAIIAGLELGEGVVLALLRGTAPGIGPPAVCCKLAYSSDLS
jgi:hypothetical protein